MDRFHCSFTVEALYFLTCTQLIQRYIFLHSNSSKLGMLFIYLFSIADIHLDTKFPSFSPPVTMPHPHSSHSSFPTGLTLASMSCLCLFDPLNLNRIAWEGCYLLGPGKNFIDYTIKESDIPFPSHS